MAAKAERDLPELAKRATAAKAALSVERSALTTKKEKAREALQDLYIA